MKVVIFLLFCVLLVDNIKVFASLVTSTELSNLFVSFKQVGHTTVICTGFIIKADTIASVKSCGQSFLDSKKSPAHEIFPYSLGRKIGISKNQVLSLANEISFMKIQNSPTFSTSGLTYYTPSKFVYGLNKNLKLVGVLEQQTEIRTYNVTTTDLNNCRDVGASAKIFGCARIQNEAQVCLAPYGGSLVENKNFVGLFISQVPHCAQTFHYIRSDYIVKYLP